MSDVPEAGPRHRGAREKWPSAWWMLAGAVLMQGATSPGQTVGVSVFVDQMAADLDLSRSGVSSAYLIGTIAGGTGPAETRTVRWSLDVDR